MKVEATKLIKYRISARNCTPDELANILKDLGAPDFYEGSVEIFQECDYDCDGYPTPTGLYTIDFVGGANAQTLKMSKEEVTEHFEDPDVIKAFFGAPS